MMNNDDYGHVGISIVTVVPRSGQRRRPNQKLAHLRSFEAVYLMGIRIGVATYCPIGAGLPRQTDLSGVSRYVSKVPKCDIARQLENERGRQPSGLEACEK
jgi:hypothetical protein